MRACANSRAASTARGELEGASGRPVELGDQACSLVHTRRRAGRAGRRNRGPGMVLEWSQLYISTKACSVFQYCSEIYTTFFDTLCEVCLSHSSYSKHTALSAQGTYRAHVDIIYVYVSLTVSLLFSRFVLYTVSILDKWFHKNEPTALSAPERAGTHRHTAHGGISDTHYISLVSSSLMSAVDISHITVQYGPIEIDSREAVSRFLNVHGKSGRQSVNTQFLNVHGKFSDGKFSDLCGQ